MRAVLQAMQHCPWRTRLLISRFLKSKLAVIGGFIVLLIVVASIGANWISPHDPYRIDADAIVILEVFEKRTKQVPEHVIEVCRQRIREYDAWESGGSNG